MDKFTSEQVELIAAVRREQGHGVLRALLTNAERKTAAELVSAGVLKKGVADLISKPVAFFLA